MLKVALKMPFTDIFYLFTERQFLKLRDLLIFAPN